MEEKKSLQISPWYNQKEISLNIERLLHSKPIKLWLKVTDIQKYDAKDERYTILQGIEFYA